MIKMIARRCASDESGIAMVMAVVLSSVIATLAITSLTVAGHSDKASARGRHWVQALDVAESGVEQAIAKIQALNGVYSGTFTGTTEEGGYTTTVTRLARSTYRVDSVGQVRGGRQLGATRRLRVTLAPPKSFSNAMFSFTTVELKNDDIIRGSIWANQIAIIANGALVTGDVTAATGYLTAGTNSEIDGNVWTGGFDATTNFAVHLDSNSTVKGGIKASVSNPPDPITCGGASHANYMVRLETGSTVNGTIETWGTVAGPGTVGALVTDNSCTPAPPIKTMPQCGYSSSNYDSTTRHEFGTPTTPSATAVADFQAYLSGQGGNLSGTFYINQSGQISQSTRLDLTGGVIRGDTNIITNTPIFANGVTDNTTDAVVLLASTYRPPVATSCDVNHDGSECSVHLKNNFATSGVTATLVYTPFGPTAVKNNAILFGAIYADSIVVKNNEEITYDSRVERIVGCGPVTLEVTKWLDVTP